MLANILEAARTLMRLPFFSSYIRHCSSVADMVSHDHLQARQVLKAFFVQGGAGQWWSPECQDSAARIGSLRHHRPWCPAGRG